MFIAKEFVFLELQKTGGSHILHLLSRLIDGEVMGKHNRPGKEITDKFVIGSIRNPWDWYVSLWAYGVSGRGAIRARTCKGLDFSYYTRMLPKSMGKNWLGPTEMIQAVIHDYQKPTAKWDSTYQDENDPLQFQTWIRLMLSEERRFDFGEGFAFSPLSRHAGLMTYRYLRLFTLGNRIYQDKNLAYPERLEEFNNNHSIANAIIRNESLEDDFIAALEKAGYAITPEQINEIRNSGKTNRSKRNKAAFYYDEETLNLVAKKERFIIEKYDYAPPTLEAKT